MTVDVALRREEGGRGAVETLAESRGSLKVGSGSSATLELESDFEPNRIVVDPAVRVLQLQRRAASVKL